MRKGTQAAQRFPQSSLLFKFCLSVLEFRKQNTKIHDQDVGNILQYSPSDTSHWKRGKKAVKSIYALEALSRALDVDFETIHDVSDGSLNYDEAWFEFLEAEESRGLLGALPPDLQEERRRRQGVLERFAESILQQAAVSSVPIYVPEIVSSLPFLQLVQGDVSDKLARSVRVKKGQYLIKYRKGDMRAHTRVAIMREVARIILLSERETFGLPERMDQLAHFEVQDLSNALLVPGRALGGEFQKVPTRLNSIKALADSFWVPKCVVRARLTHLLLSQASDDVFSSVFSIKQEFRGALSSLVYNDMSEEDGEDDLLDS